MNKIHLTDIDEIIEYEKLDNGFEIYLYKTPNKKNFEVNYYVNYGGRITKYEVDNELHLIKPGTAHFLEHSMFHKEGETYFSIFDNLGQYVNAYTNPYITNYLIEGKRNFEEGFQNLITLANTFFKNKELSKKEKDIVVQEIKMYDSDVSRFINENLFNTIVHDVKENPSVIGTEETVRSIELDELELIFNTFYAPNNCKLFIYGDFEMSYIKKLLGENKDFSNRLVSSFSYKIEEDNYLLPVKEKTFSSPLIDTKKNRIVFKYEYQDIKTFELNDAIIDILFNTKSTFRENLIKDDVVTSFSYSYMLNNNTELLVFSFEGDNEVEVLRRIEDTFLNYNITELEYNRHKKSLYSTLIRRSIKPENVIGRMLVDNIYYNKIIVNYNELIIGYSIDEINKQKRLLNNNNSIIIRYVKEGEENVKSK